MCIHRCVYIYIYIERERVRDRERERDIHIYIYICVYVCMYIHIYIYICKGHFLHSWLRGGWAGAPVSFHSARQMPLSRPPLGYITYV